MTNETMTVRFRIYGIVQGVGFRPTVDRHAKAAGIRGSVCNRGPYVEIVAQGSSGQVACFRELLSEQPPRRAAILKIDEKSLSSADAFDDFSIVESEKTSGEIYISPDIAICEECEAELFDPGNRRYLHPFINCTCCGPRLTILDALPYDRERTSMKMFPMCRKCAEEYHDPLSRRYDAQPVCCNDCGPQVRLLPVGKEFQGSIPGEEGALSGSAAITAARRIILKGGIVAVKGIGGFHLCCDASNEDAVRLLRIRKRRPAKPFAVMMRDKEAVRRECLMDAEQEKILTGHQKPILLLERKDPGSFDPAKAGTAPLAEGRRPGLAPSIAPGNPRIGVMLPYTPLHLLLFSYTDGLEMPDSLVMTSGNVSGAPICRDDADVMEQLADFCDCVLTHDRLIRIRADDTVMDFHRGSPYMIRRSRGFAPLPVLLSEAIFQRKGTSASGGTAPACVLAIGGELKNTFCIASGNLFYLSPYVGDLEDLRTGRALLETVEVFETLLEVRPCAVVCDLHPKYHSAEIARDLALQKNIPLYRIQHHYAHVLSCMAENDYSDPVIGVSFDGTGYGTDGTIWGGEIMTADCGGFERMFSIAPFLQIGGDASARQGWRIAAAMIWEYCKKSAAAENSVGNTVRGASAAGILAGENEGSIALYTKIVETLSLCDRQSAVVQRLMAERRMQAVMSTSAGRLFDAVSAMLGICRESTYEGEASMELQFAAERQLQRGGIRAASAGMKECGKAGEKRSAESGGRSPAGLKVCNGVSEKSSAERGGRSPAGLKVCNDVPEKVSAERGGKVHSGMEVCRGVPESAEQNALRRVPRRMATDTLFAQLLERRLEGEDPERLALDFHEGLAGLIVRACGEVSEITGIRTAALTGGCFQNRLLLSLTEDGLRERGFRVLIHHMVPPNDGGISLGQAAAGMAQITTAVGGEE